MSSYHGKYMDTSFRDTRLPAPGWGLFSLPIPFDLVLKKRGIQKDGESLERMVTHSQRLTSVSGELAPWKSPNSMSVPFSTF